MGWFNTIVKVVHTAAGLYLNNVRAEDCQNDTGKVTTRIGALTFIRDLQQEKTTVQNADKTKYYIYFSRVDDKGELLSRQCLIPPNETLDVTDTMKTYYDGQITYAPAFENSNSTVISFTAEYILHDITTFSDDEDPKLKYWLTRNSEADMFIFSATQKFDTFEISFNDKNNINFNLRDVKIDQPTPDRYEARVDLPPGCDHNYPFKDVKIHIGISGQHAEYLQQKLLKRNG
jgi:hypothetical protein